MLKKTDETYFDGEREVEKPSVAIIGAGFGGLSAAMLLLKKGTMSTFLIDCKLLVVAGHPKLKKDIDLI